jgi:subtilisin family serine protease
VYIEYDEFEGRAASLRQAPNLPNTVVDGHGSIVAGIAAGKTYGVAKKANIIAVKVLNTNTGTPPTLSRESTTYRLISSAQIDLPLPAWPLLPNLDSRLMMLSFT